MGASSDHLIVESDRFELSVGAVVIFQLKHSALVRAMTSPFVTKVMSKRSADQVLIDSVS
jgi:predicted amino acid racemase